MSIRTVQMFDGKVACPYVRNGTVGVEVCCRCRRLRAFFDEESGTRVACAGPLWSRRFHRRREQP